MAAKRTSLKKQRQQPADRYALLAESFVRYLVRYLPGFRHESGDTKRGLATMIFEAPTRYRAHSHYEGYARFSYQELEERFGRDQFQLINARLNIFSVRQDEQGRDDWSSKEARTKAYLLTDQVTDLRDRYLGGCMRRSPTAFLTEAGDHLVSLPASALGAKNSSTGQTRMGFKGLPVEVKVPVNLFQMHKLLKEIQARLYSHETQLPTTQGLFGEAVPNITFLRDLQQETMLMVTKARSQHWPGHVLHRYFESSTGRIYAAGVPNLQGCYRVLREVAMSGLYDTDIENCHYTILEQMAAEHGYQCQAVPAYLADKEAVRYTLEVEFGITEAQAKQALIALIYGARFSMRERDALPKILKSPQLAMRVYQHHIFRGLRDDIGQARKAILSGQTITRRTMKNIRGLTINVDQAEPSQQLAHLLQGVEVAALEAAYRLHGGRIVLLQHDGFTSTKRLEGAPIEAAMAAATGYTLKVKQRVIQPNLDDAYGSHPEIKNQIDFSMFPVADQRVTQLHGDDDGS
jgi:hypothetical protein